MAFVHAQRPDRAKAVLLDSGFDASREATSLRQRILLFTWAKTVRADGDPEGALDIVDRLVDSAPGGDQKKNNARLGAPARPSVARSRPP